MKFRFPIIIIDEDFRSENISGSGIRDLAEAIENEGMEVIGLTSYGDLTSFAQQASRASTFIVSIDDEEFVSDSEDHDLPALNNLRAFITEVRKRNEDIPIFLHGETRTSRHMPNDILRELHGFIHMNEDTPEFVARHIIREAKVYLDSLAPPFFRFGTTCSSVPRSLRTPGRVRGFSPPFMALVRIGSFRFGSQNPLVARLLRRRN